MPSQRRIQQQESSLTKDWDNWAHFAPSQEQILSEEGTSQSAQTWYTEDQQFLREKRRAFRIINRIHQAMSEQVSNEWKPSSEIAFTASREDPKSCKYPSWEVNKHGWKQKYDISARFGRNFDPLCFARKEVQTSSRMLVVP